MRAAILAVLGAAAIVFLFAPARAERPCTPPFGPGEELRFAVKFGPVRAGDAVLSVRAAEPVDGEPVIRLVSTAESNRFFQTFFPVKDRVESLWSMVRFVPLRFEKHIREGKYEKDQLLVFQHDAGRVIDQKGRAHEIAPGAQDVLSAFYYVRSVPLAVGDTLRIPNHADGKSYVLPVRVLDKEEVEVPAGTFSCIVVEPLLGTAGLFKQEGRLTIWLTDDSRRMPVLMRSKVAVGAIVAELEAFRLGRPVLPQGRQ
jgi:hypothetical protein